MNWLDFCEESTFRLAEFNHLCTSLCPVRLTRLFALISLISILEIKGLKYLLSDLSAAEKGVRHCTSTVICVLPCKQHTGNTL